MQSAWLKSLSRTVAWLLQDVMLETEPVGICWKNRMHLESLGSTNWYHFVRSSPTLIESRSLQVVFLTTTCAWHPEVSVMRTAGPKERT